MNRAAQSFAPDLPANQHGNLCLRLIWLCTLGALSTFRLPHSTFLPFPSSLRLCVKSSITERNKPRNLPAAGLALTLRCGLRDYFFFAIS